MRFEGIAHGILGHRLSKSRHLLASGALLGSSGPPSVSTAQTGKSYAKIERQRIEAFKAEVLQVWRLELISLADAPRILTPTSTLLTHLRSCGSKPKVPLRRIANTDRCNISTTVAIFVGPGEMGSWQQREVDVALDLQSRNPHLPVIGEREIPGGQAGSRQAIFLTVPYLSSLQQPSAHPCAAVPSGATCW
jgi:hypothetical protein